VRRCGRGLGRAPRVGELRCLRSGLLVAKVLIAYAAELGLLPTVDCHCHCVGGLLADRGKEASRTRGRCKVQLGFWWKELGSEEALGGRARWKIAAVEVGSSSGG